MRIVAVALLTFSIATAAGCWTPTTAKTPQCNEQAVFCHTVQKGETLWEMAERFYGDGEKWRLISGANPCLKEQSPHLWKPGLVLVWCFTLLLSYQQPLDGAGWWQQ
jgi:nucleoid-associated protein YgaU